MKAPDFRADLKLEDSLRQAQGISPPAQARVWARLSAPRRPRPVWHWGAAAAAACALVLAVVFARALLGGAPGGQVLAMGEAVELSREASVLVDEASGVTVKNLGPLSVRREAQGIRVVRGRAEFEVKKRPATAPPAVVLVSGGAIRVMGTRFVVEQREESGQVTLYEGRITFQTATGAPIALDVGQTLHWPPRTAPENPAASARAPAPVPAQAAPPALEATLQEVDVLRSRKEFARAAQVLERALRIQPVASRERLSFELGSLLTYQLRDRRRACAHWAAHAQKFQRGRYDDAISQARAALSCRGREPKRGP
jgi:transmembrane sensor